MNTLNQALVILHFIGLAMGFSASFANMAMSGLIARAAPEEKAVLGRFPPIMSRIGTIGLALLWVTGGVLVYTRWAGVAALPWQFHAKLAAVVLLTATVTSIHRLERLVGKGDAAAAARIEAAGKIATSSASVAVVFAVLTFD